MPRPRRRKWHVRRADYGFFPLPRGSTNCVLCITRKAAMRYCRMAHSLGSSPVLERWVYLTKRSPKRRGAARYMVTTYELL